MKKILFVGAHFDDIELACGGFISKLAKKNYIVKMLIMANPTNPLRYKEGLNVKEYLRVRYLNVLNFKDMYVPYNGDSVKEINEIVDSFNPDLIFTHWVFDTHQDHRNTALATISACRYKNNIFMYEPIHPSGKSYCSFKPQVYIDISDTINNKIKSQRGTLTRGSKSRAKLRGFESHNKYAEAFELLRMELKI